MLILKERYCQTEVFPFKTSKQKDQHQSLEKIFQKNLDIPFTRFYLERFNRRVCNFTILNNVWSMNRIDLRSSNLRILSHIVNITMPPIGPQS